MKANNTKISGLNISGATASGYGGIYLYYTSNCTIENNKLYNNAAGVFLWYADKNNILSNTATNNGDYGGILLQASKFNTISGNKVTGNKRGVYFATSPNNTLSSNTIQYSTGDWGLFVCGHSPDSLIYNNYINETNVSIRRTLVGGPDILNVPKKAGPNIVGGPYIGGNFWGKPDKTGFSQTAVDKNGDGFADSAYINATGSPFTDNLPLVNPVAVVKPVASFTVSPTSGVSTSTNCTFTSTSTNSPTTWTWSFGDGGTASGSKVTHKFTKAGTLTVTLTANNSAGSSTASKTVSVAAVKPVASFTYSPSTVKKGTTITFTSTSTNIPTALKWTFADNSATSSASKVTHIFSKTGQFKVTLLASNSAGNSTVYKTITVS